MHNSLINETSPYLLQHANNPVEWYPWGEKALKKAQAEDKLMLISIGYSACHWCHVMEHESFEAEEVAKLMNAHFICIKVDREERPDIDKIYMEAVQMISGQGGWPLNCFALPNGKPVWGGTYFQKRQWLQVLDKLATMYSNDKGKLMSQADQLTNNLQHTILPKNETNTKQLDVFKAIINIETRFDKRFGGLGSAPKFPMPVALNLLHQVGLMENNNTLLSFIELTLDRMASSGIYDQVGGGFARYAVDERWFAPHFEKMLYDNAQLISLYSNAYKSYKNQHYKRIVDETIAFAKRELLSTEGAFYSALDADSEDEEGKFYVWSYKELKEILGDDSHFFNYFNIKENGNWEFGNNILHGGITRESYANNCSISSDRINQSIKLSLSKLLEAREKRTRPELDNKILTSWNGLMIKALCDAHQAFGNLKYLELAENAMDYLLSKAVKSDGKVIRSGTTDGFLDDYAFIIDALVSLYEVTFNEGYLAKAELICEYAYHHFYNSADGLFYYNSKSGEQLIARKSDLQDNVIPSSVGAIANSFIRLHQLIHLPKYETVANNLITNMSALAKEHPSYYAQWALLNQLQTKRQEIVIVGAEAKTYRAQLQKQLRPGAIFAGQTNNQSSLKVLQNRYKEGATLIYKCKNKTCELPVDRVELLP